MEASALRCVHSLSLVPCAEIVSNAMMRHGTSEGQPLPVHRVIIAPTISTRGVTPIEKSVGVRPKRCSAPGAKRRPARPATERRSAERRPARPKGAGPSDLGCRPSPKLHPVGKWLIYQLSSGQYPTVMITLLLHLLPLRRPSPARPGDLALRQQLAVYKRTVPRPRLRTMDRLLWVGWPESGPAGSRLWSSCRPTRSCGGSAVASVSTGPGSPAGLGWAARRSTRSSRPGAGRWPR